MRTKVSFHFQGNLNGFSLLSKFYSLGLYFSVNDSYKQNFAIVSWNEWLTRVAI